MPATQIFTFDELKQQEIPRGHAKDLTNKKFNNLTARFRIATPLYYKKPETMWACECDCGNWVMARATCLLHGTSAKDCGCSQKYRLEGQRFGTLTVISQVPKENPKSPTYWKCQCDCGNEKIANTNQLLSGVVNNCGCKYDITGKKFDKLIVLYATNEFRGTDRLWHCRCDCGKEIDVRRSSLINNYIHSCGCMSISCGEYRIIKALEENKIDYIKEWKHDTCRFLDTGALARFDFYLPQYNTIIEFDGEQHFNYKEKVAHWSTKERVEKTKQHDEFKNNWCKENNISLIRIPYTEVNKITSDYIKNLLKKPLAAS